MIAPSTVGNVMSVRREAIVVTVGLFGLASIVAQFAIPKGYFSATRVPVLMRTLALQSHFRHARANFRNLAASHHCRSATNWDPSLFSKQNGQRPRNQ